MNTHCAASRYRPGHFLIRCCMMPGIFPGVYLYCVPTNAIGGGAEESSRTLFRVPPPEACATGSSTCRRSCHPPALYALGAPVDRRPPTVHDICITQNGCIVLHEFSYMLVRVAIFHFAKNPEKPTSRRIEIVLVTRRIAVCHYALHTATRGYRP